MIEGCLADNKETLINTQKIQGPLFNEIVQFLKHPGRNKKTLNQANNSKSSNTILFGRKEALVFKKPSLNLIDVNFSKIRFWNLPPSSKKKTLILDLDETLVHSNFSPIKNPDAVLTIKNRNQSFFVYLMIRPGVFELLMEASKNFEIIIFTASQSQYADPIINYIDKTKAISHRLYREHCTLTTKGMMKDLSKLNRSLKDMVLIDNCPISYSFHKSNALPITSWYDDKYDTNIFEYIKIINFLFETDDIRNYVPLFVDEEIVNFEKFNKLVIEKKDSKNLNMKIKLKLNTSEINTLNLKRNDILRTPSNFNRSIKDKSINYNPLIRRSKTISRLKKELICRIPLDISNLTQSQNKTTEIELRTPAKKQDNIIIPPNKFQISKSKVFNRESPRMYEGYIMETNHNERNQTPSNKSLKLKIKINKNLRNIKSKFVGKEQIKVKKIKNLILKSRHDKVSSFESDIKKIESRNIPSLEGSQSAQNFKISPVT